jgi:hypothetical protein
MSVISALRRQRREDPEFEASPACPRSTARVYLKTPRKKEGRKKEQMKKKHWTYVLETLQIGYRKKPKVGGVRKNDVSYGQRLKC